MKRILYILAVLLCIHNMAISQVGGRYVLEFLRLDNSARIMGLGGSAITVKDDDLAMAFRNPASLSDSCHGGLTFQHNFYLSDIQNGYFGYAHHLKNTRYTLHAGVLYANYGAFDQTNTLGDITGSFKAGEQAYVLGMGSQLNKNYSVGINVKFISSHLESYSLSAFSADLSGMYYHPKHRITATLAINNMGTVLNHYTENTEGQLPLSIQIGISKRLDHLPFRYSIIFHHLNEWNIAYDDPSNREQILFIGEENPEDNGPGFADILFRHVILNGEFLLGKNENFNLRVGYNYLRRKELSLKDRFSLSGFSFGVGFKVNRFKIDYGYGGYHYSNGSHYLGISTALSEFTRKKEI